MQSNERQLLRKLIRQRRLQLSAAEQQQAATDLLAQTFASGIIEHKHHIALYLANDGELDPFLLIQALWQAGKDVYLPVLHPFTSGYLVFVRYKQDTLLYPNKFGIPEPLLECQHILPLSQLDVIFTPLVAFDAQGNRLGMGGGFYDRTLSQLPTGSHCDVIGMAHDCQQVEQVPTEAWDVPLKRIITPAKLWCFD